MELGIKKPKTNFSYRDNEISISERGLKKDSNSKSGMIMLDQTRNKSLSNINRKSPEILKPTTYDKSSNLDQRKYIEYKRETVSILQNQLHEKKNKSSQGNNLNNYANVSINTNLNKYTQQASISNSSLANFNSNNSQLNKNTFNINSNRVNYPNSQRDNSPFANQISNNPMSNFRNNNSNIRSHRENFNDTSNLIASNPSNLAGNYGNNSNIQPPNKIKQTSNIETNSKNSFLIDPKHKKSVSLISDNFSAFNNNYARNDPKNNCEQTQSYINNNNNTNLKSPHRITNNNDLNSNLQREAVNSIYNGLKDSNLSNNRVNNENDYISQNVEASKIKNSATNFNRNLNRNSSNSMLIQQNFSTNNMLKTNSNRITNNRPSSNESQKNNYIQEKPRAYNNNLNYPKPNISEKEEVSNKAPINVNSRSNSKDGGNYSQGNQKAITQNKQNPNCNNSPIRSAFNNNYISDNINAGKVHERYAIGKNNSLNNKNELNQNVKNSISRNYINFVPEKSPQRKTNFPNNYGPNERFKNNGNMNQANTSQKSNAIGQFNKENSNGNINSNNNNSKNSFNLTSQNQINAKNSYFLRSKNSNPNSSNRLNYNSNSNYVEEPLIEATPIKEDKVMHTRDFEENSIMTNENNQRINKTKSRVNTSLIYNCDLKQTNPDIYYEKENYQDKNIKNQNQNYNCYQKINNNKFDNLHEQEERNQNNFYNNSNSSMNNYPSRQPSNNRRNDSILTNSEICSKKINEITNSQINNNNNNSSYLTNSQSSQNYILKNNIYSAHKKSESTTAMIIPENIATNPNLKRNNELITSQARNYLRGNESQNQFIEGNNSFNSSANMNQIIPNNSRSNSRSPNYSSRNHDLKGSTNSKNSYIQPKYESRVENAQNHLTPSEEKYVFTKNNLVYIPNDEKENSSKFINNYKNFNANNSGYNIENSLYGSNLNGSSVKCTTNNRDNSTSQMDNSINQIKNRNFRTNTRNNRSEDYENDEFTFTTEIPINMADKKISTEENNARKNNNNQNEFAPINAPHEKNIYYKINPKNMQRVNEQIENNHKIMNSPIVNNQEKNLSTYSKQKINSKFNNSNTSAKKDFSFEKNSKGNIMNNSNNTPDNLENNKNEDNNPNDNDDYIENNTTNTNLETNTYRKVENNSYYSEFLANKVNAYPKQKVGRQNILNQNDEFEYRNNLCTDRTPHTKLGVKINVNYKHNNSVGTNQIQIQLKNERENSSYMNEYNKNSSKVMRNVNQLTDNNLNYSNNNSVNNFVNNITDAMNHSSNALPSENNIKNNIISLKSPNVAKTSERNNQNKIINKAQNPNSNRNNLTENAVNSAILNHINAKINPTNTFNKSYITNTQNSASTNQTPNVNAASINSTIGNNNNNIPSKNFIHMKSSSANGLVFANILKEKEINQNTNKEIKESLNTNSELGNSNKMTHPGANENLNHIKTLIDTKDSNKTKPHSLNYNTNFTTNHEENKFLCSKNIESIEEMHYQITAVLQSFNKIIRIQEVASEKENIFQTVNKCDEKEID